MAVRAARSAYMAARCRSSSSRPCSPRTRSSAPWPGTPALSAGPARRVRAAGKNTATPAQGGAKPGAHRDGGGWGRAAGAARAVGFAAARLTTAPTTAWARNPKGLGGSVSLPVSMRGGISRGPLARERLAAAWLCPGPEAAGRAACAPSAMRRLGALAARRGRLGASLHRGHNQDTRWHLGSLQAGSAQLVGSGS